MDYANDNLSLECNYLYYENAELMKAHNLISIINSEELWMSEHALSQLSLTAKNYKNNFKNNFSKNFRKLQNRYYSETGLIEAVLFEVFLYIDYGANGDVVDYDLSSG